MKTVCIVGIFLLWAFCGMAQTGGKNFIDQNYMEVTGTAEMEVVPDEIYLKIVISEKDKGKKKLEEQEKRMIEALEKLGIEVRKDLLVKDLTSDFKNYFLKRAAILTEKEYELCMHGSEKVGPLVLALEAAGISNISVDRVNHSQLEKYRREVKVNAVKAAKEKAEAFAEALGQQVGSALYVAENDNGYYTPQKMVANIRVRGTNVLEESPVLDFKKIQLKYSVIVCFELKK